MDPSDIFSKIEAQKVEFLNVVQKLLNASQNLSPDQVEGLRIRFTGKKGVLGAFHDELKTLSKDLKPTVGKAINELSRLIEEKLTNLKESAHRAKIQADLDKRFVDTSLPVETWTGSLHPVTLVRQEVLSVFRRMGFAVVDGPECDTEFYNFTALNVPDNHPARDMQDTFYLENSNAESLVLRTHTSNIQIHGMKSNRPPMRMVAPGRVFRYDSDATHTPMFHQIEGFVVDHNISFADLKGTVDTLIRALFGHTSKTRFRPSFFPFTEPSAEVDLQCTLCKGAGCSTCKNTGWIEVGGCGMIHPNVFEMVSYDSSEWSGFAFGFGLDRLALNKFGLNDLRHLFAGDYKFLSQFPTYFRL